MQLARVIGDVVSSHKDASLVSMKLLLLQPIGQPRGIEGTGPERRGFNTEVYSVMEIERIGKVEPESMLPITYGPEWGYRHRARLSVRYLTARGAMVGFRERRSTHVAEMHECRVLPPAVSALLVPLRELVGKLSIRERLPQVEVAVAVAQP
mgnify:CR=1 FL=1